MIGSLPIKAPQSTFISRYLVKVFIERTFEYLVNEQAKEDGDQTSDNELQVVNPIISKFHVVVEAVGPE